MNYEFHRLKDLLDDYPENEVKALVLTFRCSLEPDVEHFLHLQAIDFENRHLSRTYLWIDSSKPQVIAYFSLSLKSLELNLRNISLSQTKLRKLFYGFPPTKEEMEEGVLKPLPVYLIGQLGRHEEISPDVFPGEYILDTAKAKIKECFETVGCKLIIVEVLDGDSETKQKLVEFYTRNGFRKLDTFIEEGKTLTRFYYVIKN
jgi:hypothetical protein